jgi:hypothetical protein
MAGIKIVDAKVSFQYPLEGYAKESEVQENWGVNQCGGGGSRQMIGDGTNGLSLPCAAALTYSITFFAFLCIPLKGVLK